MNGPIAARRGAPDDVDELQAFAYATSHDLSEPLRAITGFVHLLDRSARPKLDADELEYLEFIVNGAERMRALLDGLLAYSRVVTHAGTPEEVDLRAVADATLEHLRDDLRHAGATVELGELPVVTGDPGQLGQVVSELVTNALRFRRADREPQIRIDARPVSGGWVIDVVDNGIGIAARDRCRILEMFAQLNRRDEYEGHGVGLAVVARIVSRHGGTISVDDGIDGGTTLRVTLPDGGGGIS